MYPSPDKITPSTLHYTWMRYTFHEFMAIRYMYIHFVNLIVTEQAGKTPLHHAARSEVVNALLKAGSKVDETDQVNIHVLKVFILNCVHSMHVHVEDYNANVM